MPVYTSGTASVLTLASQPQALCCLTHIQPNTHSTGSRSGLEWHPRWLFAINSWKKKELLVLHSYSLGGITGTKAADWKVPDLTLPLTSWDIPQSQKQEDCVTLTLLEFFPIGPLFRPKYDHRSTKIPPLPIYEIAHSQDYPVLLKLLQNALCHIQQYPKSHSRLSCLHQYLPGSCIWKYSHMLQNPSTHSLQIFAVNRRNLQLYFRMQGYTNGIEGWVPHIRASYKQSLPDFLFWSRT